MPGTRRAISAPEARLAAIALAALGCAVLPSAAVDARDDVPPEIAARENPETLEPSEIRYYARHFKAKCARCHGADGQGGGDEAEDQPVPPTDFTDAVAMAKRSDGQLFYQILAGGGARCAMPAFGPGSDHGWSEERIWHMVAFVRRFASPPRE